MFIAGTRNNKWAQCFSVRGFHTMFSVHFHTFRRTQHHIQWKWTNILWTKIVAKALASGNSKLKRLFFYFLSTLARVLVGHPLADRRIKQHSGRNDVIRIKTRTYTTCRNSHLTKPTQNRIYFHTHTPILPHTDAHCVETHRQANICKQENHSYARAKEKNCEREI